MTERERWVVYPLLFLALGAALRDKLVDRTTTKSIVCQELRIVDEETSNGQPPRDLARIGRHESPSGRGTAAYFIINGQVEIIDDDPAGIQPARSLIRLGRTESSPGSPAIGRVAISGQVNVDGSINSRQYAYHGIPFMPPLQLLPGIPDMTRPPPQLQPGQQPPNTPRAPSQKKSPAPPEPKSREEAPPSSPAGGEPAKTK